MLEQKIRLKLSMSHKEPVNRVIQFWTEYCEAYERLHKPSEKHVQDYCNLMNDYSRYVQKYKHYSEKDLEHERKKDEEHDY